MLLNCTSYLCMRFLIIGVFKTALARGRLYGGLTVMRICPDASVTFHDQIVNRTKAYLTIWKSNQAKINNR